MTQTITRPSLPGEPELPGESNAKAKLASIVAAHQLEIWANDRDTVLTDWSDLRSSLSSTAPDILELLEDYDVTESDCDSDVIDDVIWQFCRDTPLSCEVRSSWYSAGDEAPQPSEFRIWLTFGGPSCLIRGEFEGYGVDVETLQLCFSWASIEHTLPLNQDATDALAWFCESLVC